MSLPAGSSALARRSRRRQTVAIFGGGIAGLTAAHELAERGFDVTVYERRAWGGKARSTEVPRSGRGGRKDLPGEHGWRIFFGFYQNTIDSFRRIPFASNPQGVFNNLTSFSTVLFARDQGRRDLILPFGLAEQVGATPADVINAAVGLLLRDTYLQPEAVAYLGNRLAVYFSSCDARRVGEWENVRWTDFAGADRFNDDYRKILVNSFSEVVQASKAENTSASFPAHVLELIIYNVLGRYSNGPTVRMLDHPANEALFDPWLRVLRGHGVKLKLHAELARLRVHGGRIRAAEVIHQGRPHGVEADFYLLAVPVERARKLWDAAILEAAPELRRMRRLDTGWMNGIKFFLRKPPPISEGALVCVDSPWQITAVPQARLWRGDFASTYGDGQVHESLSAIVSRWTAPGVLYGKPARECTPKQVIHEVWEQLKRHVNSPGNEVLTDDLVHSWDIDPGMIRRDHHLVSDDPLVLPAVGQREDRPDVSTSIPNLFLAGDYLRSSWEVANMETASYNARRSVNAILGQSGSREGPTAVIEPPHPPEWEPLKRIDEDRYRRGLPNALDLG